MHRLIWVIAVVVLASCAPKSREQAEPLLAPIHTEARPVLPSRSTAAPLIVLDAGHGGHDDGARCLAPVYPEKKATLQLALILQKRLTALGYRVALTRCQDLFLALHERAALANQRGASAFVSLHFNHCGNATAKGLEVFYCLNDPMLKRDLLSKQMAESVLRTALEATHCRDRGVKEANFVVIRTTRMPSILVEGGFLSNAEEGRMIAEIPFLERLAQGIALGLHQYFLHVTDADAPVSVYSEVAGRKPAPVTARAKQLAKPAKGTSMAKAGAAAGSFVSKNRIKPASTRKDTSLKTVKPVRTRA